MNMFKGSNNLLQESSLITARQRSIVIIEDSSFSYNFGVYRGSVAWADYQKALISFKNSNFSYNAATDGGVFSALFESQISCSKCLFTHNFGLQSGIISVYQDGYFDLQAEIF